MRVSRLVAISGLVLTITPGSPAFADALTRWQGASPAVRARALSLARQAFDAYVRERRVIDCPANLPAEFSLRSGVFVSTMDPGGAPRCCMGTLYPVEPDIAHEIIANAVAAAGRDRRFKAITITDLSRLRLIVSIVGRPEPVGDASALDPVRDGLVARYADRDGVVLSGETPHLDLMLRWARTRAGAPAGASVALFRLNDVRMMEEKKVP